MVNGPRICVSVVEGYFARLKGVGMPLALCVQLQEHKLMFSTVRWMMRQSHAGLSISLFWSFSSVKPVPKKWQRRQWKLPAQSHTDSRGCKNSPLTLNSDSRPAPQSWEKAGIPDSAHSDVSQEQDLSTNSEDPPKHELVDMELDLTECGVWDERRCTWVSFLQGWISRMDFCGALVNERADTEDDSN